MYMMVNERRHATRPRRPPSAATVGSLEILVRPEAIPARDTEREQTFYGGLSKAAYKQDDPSLIPKGWRPAPELTDDQAHRPVYTDGTHAVVAFRGTRLTDTSDLRADVSIALGTESGARRFTDAEALTQQLIDRFGKDNVTATGHSLGGSEALDVSRKLGVRATAFNPGASPLSAIEASPIHTGSFALDFLLGSVVQRFTNRSVDTTVYSTATDPISVSARLQGYKRQRSVGVADGHSAHDVDNFLGN